MRINSSPTFFGLLYIDLSPKKESPNIKNKDRQCLINIYVNNACLLSQSLNKHNIKFVLLTNNKEYLDQRCDLEIEEIDIKLKVPESIGFYSAHFKLDAFRHISKKSSGYYLLCDLDVVCLSEIPPAFENIINESTPCFYDITFLRIFNPGANALINDLSKINGVKSEGRWSGGEIIGGHPKFFKLLTSECENLIPIYFAHHKHLHHVGDEMYTSAALELIRKSGYYISDLGSLNVIRRFWSVLNKVPIIKFRKSRLPFLMHLPADKLFISEYYKKNRSYFKISHFIRCYELYCLKTCVISYVKRVIKRFIPKFFNI